MGNTRGKLGVLDGAALVVSTVIGAGIFTVPSLIASLTGALRDSSPCGSPAASLRSLARSYAELASRLPDAGGEYVYLREAFGPVAGFLSGWTSFIAGFSGAIAASAVGFARYLTPIWPSVGDRRSRGWARSDQRDHLAHHAHRRRLDPRLHSGGGCGLDSSRRTNNALAVLLIAGIVTFIALGAVRLPGAPSLAAAPVAAGGIMESRPRWCR
jgi:APA family basic amino acid/polyamine antiporter